ncbi:hypothetical protein PM082_024496 [Marasmius tenuissimus]|nr:hypothetical protein PM082_024496 [Marasmius tenuissimus]
MESNRDYIGGFNKMLDDLNLIRSTLDAQQDPLCNSCNTAGSRRKREGGKPQAVVNKPLR